MCDNNSIWWHVLEIHYFLSFEQWYNIINNQEVMNVVYFI